MARRLSCQLYSARNHGALDDRFGVLASLGYRNVEPYGALLDDAEGLAEALERHGLAAPSCHVGLDDLEADPDMAAEKAAAIGVELLVVPFIGEDRRPGDSAGWRAFGRRLAAAQSAMADRGLRLAWHNHDFEFRSTPDGGTPLELILEAAPELLWQADIGWMERAGVDSVDWLGRHGRRIVALHVKDLAPAGQAEDEDGWADVGYGVADWRRLRPAMAATNAGLYVAEHDNPSDFQRFARRSLDTMTGWAGWESG